MEKNLFKLNDKIYSNNNNILIEIVNDLKQLLDYSKDELITKILDVVINKLNNIITENNKNTELLKNDISSLCDKVNERIDELNITPKKNIKEL